MTFVSGTRQRIYYTPGSIDISGYFKFGYMSAFTILGGNVPAADAYHLQFTDPVADLHRR
ncbi:hypothetical protein F4810DRAFT_715216 [Camillea tinctor]|nr:hypothetical protein F4810DRAFT_715216 [Camillea tinctor]